MPKSKGFNMFKLLGFVFALCFTLSAPAAVWESSNTWSADWENKYSAWVQSSWHKEFFAKPELANGQKNPYYGLRVDCADTVYSMRIVFSYENSLPFTMQDPTASGKTISNQMNRWDGKSADEKIRGFLKYVYGIASTRSLPNDTYPVAINRQSVRPGGLIMTTKLNHHSWTIKDILSIGVPHLVFNSVVGAASSLTIQDRKSWPNPSWVFEGDQTPAGNAGFRYWRPAEYLNTPVWKVPGYSDEQYKIPLKQWVRTAQQRLATNTESDTQMMNRLLTTTCEAAGQRIASVKEGLDYIAKNPRCMDYATYDNYSTPNRDNRLFDDYMALRNGYKDIVHANGGNQLSSQLKAQLDKIFPEINQSAKIETSRMAPSEIGANSVCVIEYGKGQKMDLAELKRRLFAGLISNNPHDGFEYRWGLKKGPSPEAKACPSWDLWSPDFSQE